MVGRASGQLDFPQEAGIGLEHDVASWPEEGPGLTEGVENMHLEPGE